MSSHRVIPSALLNFAQRVLPLLLVVLLVVTGPIGLGKPPGSNPPPPPVHYVIDVIPAPGDGSAFMDVRGINNLGIIVGQFDDEAFIYDHGTGTFLQMNAYPNLTSQLDALMGAGWSFYTASAINEVGDVVGSVADATYVATGGGSGLVRAYVMQTLLSLNPADWTVEILPVHGSDRVSGRGINDHGDVVCSYRKSGGGNDFFVFNPWLDSPQNPVPEIEFGLSNFLTTSKINNVGGGGSQIGGQVAGTIDDNQSYIFDVATQSFQYLAIPGLRVTGLNDLGVFAGYGPNNSYLYRYTSQLEILYTAASTEYVSTGLQGQMLNANSDVLFLVGRFSGKVQETAYLARAGTPNQVLKINDLIPTSDPLRNYWLASRQRIYTMTDRAATGPGPSGYPKLAGTISQTLRNGTIITTGVILTPVAPPTP